MKIVLILTLVPRLMDQMALLGPITARLKDSHIILLHSPVQMAGPKNSRHHLLLLGTMVLLLSRTGDHTDHRG